MNSIIISGYSFQELLQKAIDTFHHQSVWITGLGFKEVVEHAEYHIDLAVSKDDRPQTPTRKVVRFELKIEYANIG